MLAFVEKSFAGDPTNWWIANRSAAAALLRSAGLDIIAQPEREIFLCRPGEHSAAELNPGNPFELQHATGQQRRRTFG